MTKWKNPLVWFRGLIAAFVGGGATSVSAGIVVMGKTPDQYNLNDGLGALLFVMFATFLVSGIMNASFYLSKSPVPELEEVNTTHINKPTEP